MLDSCRGCSGSTQGVVNNGVISGYCCFIWQTVPLVEGKKKIQKFKKKKTKNKKAIPLSLILFSIFV